MKLLPAQSFIEISLLAKVPGVMFKRKAISFFLRCGISPGEIVHFETPECTRASIYTRESRQIACAEAEYHQIESPDFHFSKRLLRRKDWLDKWQDDYHMMPLGRRFMLVPLRQKKMFRSHEGRLPVYLDPMAVFGSGQHPSTQIMISLMEQIGRGTVLDSCLDLGTGTGILSVAAHRLGVKRIVACDIDAAACQAARFNLKLNGACDYSVKRINVTRLNRTEHFDLVLANLTPAVLMKAGRIIFPGVCKGGALIVSGILSREIEVFSRQFHHVNFKCLKILKRGGWGGLLLKRS